MRRGSVSTACGSSTGSNVQVTFAKNRKVRHSAGKTCEESNKYEGLLTNNKGGVETLESIHLRKLSLILEGSSSSEK